MKTDPSTDGFSTNSHDDTPSRRVIRRLHRQPDDAAVAALLAAYDIDPAKRSLIEQKAVWLIDALRARDAALGPIDALMREYDFSTDEGLVLMMLAEALIRIPDPATRDHLIRDKLGSVDFATHVEHSLSPLVNASSRVLAVTSRAIRAARGKRLWPALLVRLGEPVLRQAMLRAMSVVGDHFVLGRTIEAALARAAPAEALGLRHSYDMLGEAALTAADALQHLQAYETAIHAIGKAGAKTGGSPGPVAGPGISIKLSAIHPRYELCQRRRVLAELGPSVLALARMARTYDIGCTIDAEEADRLDLSLDIFQRLIRTPELAGWHGLGLAVQAYSKRALAVIHWLTAEARDSGRRLMVRLVKGAYWDSEIKHAQVQGLDEYPVFIDKAATDLSYLVAAGRILAAGDSLFGQFATHNAATVAAIHTFAAGRTDYEFQRLHGMGEGLYDLVREMDNTVKCRIYAPVGAHRDLLPYLVRRLIENGSSGSFLNQIANAAIPAAALAQDPACILAARPPRTIPLPRDLYQPERVNSPGFDFGDPDALAAIRAELAQTAHPAVPARPRAGLDATLDAALDDSGRAWRQWDHTPVTERAACLERAADSIAADRAAFITLAIAEAGKTLPAAVAEIREAIDLLRYYAASARSALCPVALPGPTGESNLLHYAGRGVFACISPWNFPLAIFIGQIAAALVAGNGVIAKPAPQTPRMAELATRHLRAAGLPTGLLGCLQGDGSVGAALVRDPRIGGVAFTGSTATARSIARALAARDGGIIPLIAEAGGLNAMIVDSSALLEQAVKDILVSAFDSAGQRCSALRCLYLQHDIADDLARLLAGAIAELRVGDPARIDTDIGPVIDDVALAALESHAAGLGKPFAVATLSGDAAKGCFFAPRAVWIDSITRLKAEIFGPILHVLRYPAGGLGDVLDAITATGFGLTLGLQTRIDEVVDHVRRDTRVGNLYVNRSMIGAAVGTQPFGGEGLSGTGPKAGGPNYLRRFTTERVVTINTAAAGGDVALLASRPPIGVLKDRRQ